jgi:hypothetical protein
VGACGSFLKALRHWGQLERAEGAGLALPHRHQRRLRPLPAAPAPPNHPAHRAAHGDARGRDGPLLELQEGSQRSKQSAAAPHQWLVDHDVAIACSSTRAGPFALAQGRTTRPAHSPARSPASWSVATPARYGHPGGWRGSVQYRARTFLCATSATSSSGPAPQTRGA